MGGMASDGREPSRDDPVEESLSGGDRVFADVPITAAGSPRDCLGGGLDVGGADVAEPNRLEHWRPELAVDGRSGAGAETAGASTTVVRPMAWLSGPCRARRHAMSIALS